MLFGVFVGVCRRCLRICFRGLADVGVFGMCMHACWVHTRVSWVQVGLLVGSFTSQQHGSVSQVWMCSDRCARCHTEVEDEDQSFYLTQSQNTDTGPTSPSTDPVSPGTCHEIKSLV